MSDPTPLEQLQARSARMVEALDDVRRCATAASNALERADERVGQGNLRMATAALNAAEHRLILLAGYALEAVQCGRNPVLNRALAAAGGDDDESEGE